ncbi:hypothetical protein KAI56_00920 [Candidatus Parcubacteria bacterium]|nr:hypothetical protein [Candidatus Parcubacteria bacterium]
MTEPKKVTVVTRTFQAGTGPDGKEFDTDYFSEKVARPIRNLLAGSEEVVERIIVVVNAEKGNPLAEGIYNNGQTPSERAFIEAFPEEVRDDKIIIHLCHDWGNNPGSGNALNEGMEIAQRMGAELAMCWSPEIEMNGYQISEALNFMQERNLSEVGFLRENWWEKPQWHVSQNTGKILEIKKIQNIGGFSPACNGTGKTVTTKEFGEVSLAGMEDFHAMLRTLKSDPDFRWGMIGTANPLKWDTDFPTGSERLLNHLKKVARQEAVMKEYAKQIFPELSYELVMNKLFACYHQK